VNEETTGDVLGGLRGTKKCRPYGGIRPQKENLRKGRGQ